MLPVSPLPNTTFNFRPQFHTIGLSVLRQLRTELCKTNLPHGTVVSQTAQRTASSCPHWESTLVITQDSHGNVCIETEDSFITKSLLKKQNCGNHVQNKIYNFNYSLRGCLWGFFVLFSQTNVWQTLTWSYRATHLLKLKATML